MEKYMIPKEIVDFLLDFSKVSCPFCVGVKFHYDECPLAQFEPNKEHPKKEDCLTSFGLSLKQALHDKRAILSFIIENLNFDPLAGCVFCNYEIVNSVPGFVFEAHNLLCPACINVPTVYKDEIQLKPFGEYVIKELSNDYCG